MIYNVRDLIDALIVNAPQVSADFPGESAHSVAAGGLEAVLTTMIDSDSWRENGGNAGSIRETMSLLIVQQTPENQKAVQQMLEAMRAELKAPTPATTVVPR